MDSDEFEAELSKYKVVRSSTYVNWGAFKKKKTSSCSHVMIKEGGDGGPDLSSCVSDAVEEDPSECVVHCDPLPLHLSHSCRCWVLEIVECCVGGGSAARRMLQLLGVNSVRFIVHLYDH